MKKLIKKYKHGSNLSPDWDPEHVHYHDEKGNKIDITAVANDPRMTKYKAMADAHYKEMENSLSRFILNPAYQKAYNNLRFAAGKHERSPFVDYNNLPEGLYKGTSHAKGTVLYDKQGNNYIPSYMTDEYTTVPNTPTYSVPYTDNKGNVQYVQAKMPQQYFEKPPLPVDYIINQSMVDKAKQRANQQYIKDNTSNFYEMSLFDTPYARRIDNSLKYSFESLGDNNIYNSTSAYNKDTSERVKALNSIMNKIASKSKWSNYNTDHSEYHYKKDIPILQLNEKELTKLKRDGASDKVIQNARNHQVQYIPTQQEAEKNSNLKLIFGIDY